MKHVRGEHAWLVLAALIVGYEVLAEDGELLSEAVDRFIERHPAITRTIIAGIALHLANALDPRMDPVHQLALTTRAYRTRRYTTDTARMKGIRFTRIRRRHGGQAQEAQPA